MTGNPIGVDNPAGGHFSKGRSKKVNGDLRVPGTEQSQEVRSRKWHTK